MNRVSTWSLTLITSLLLAACGGSSDQDKDVPSNKTAATNKLKPANQSDAFANYLKNGLAAGQGAFLYPVLEDGVNTTADTSSAGSKTSSTNLQVAGVDEIDRIKNSTDTLFQVRQGYNDVVYLDAAVSAPISQSNPSVEIYHLSDSPASNTWLSRINTPDNMQWIDGLYLTPAQQLVMLGTGQGYQQEFTTAIWNPWPQGEIVINSYQVSNPAQPNAQWNLQIQGNMVTSRVVGDTLYLVSRYTPYDNHLIAYPENDTQIQANKDYLNSIDINDLLPTVQINGQSQPLTTLQNCFVPDGQGSTEKSDAYQNHVITTITAIPLDDVQAFKSVCYAGVTENLYMTPSNVYLLESTYSNEFFWWYEDSVSTQGADQGTSALLSSLPINTTVHKFSLAQTDINYRGSATVPGELYSRDFQSAAFRLHENGDYLNIVTSWGWNEPEHRLTVLQEGADFALQEVAHLPNDNQPDSIGKKGEQIYAVRYFDTRAYVVTFNLTDPLYVIDLSDNTQPVIAGALEIPGYSSYLHPINANLLLGVGKDAVVDGSNTFYQGIKLALFDVSDIQNPKVKNEIGLGERGSDSNLFYDHHALSYLAGDFVDRFTVPVSLNTGRPADAPLSDYAPWQHDALYQFEIDRTAQTLKLVGSVLGSQADPENPYSYGNIYQDRAVLQGDAVHYIHQDKVISTQW